MQGGTFKRSLDGDEVWPTEDVAPDAGWLESLPHGEMLPLEAADL